jgi:hypothetical protein
MKRGEKQKSKQEKGAMFDEAGHGRILGAQRG